MRSFETASALLATAATVEQAAARRYGELADEMKTAGNAELEALFRDLAKEEAAHLQALRDWGGSADLGENAESDWRQVGPEASAGDDDPPDPYTLTAYRALSIAVHNEERAFAFFSSVAADAEDPEVRGLAERLAHEELAHAAKLRQARRAAYRAAGRRPALDRWGLPRQPIENLAEFRAAATGLEAGMAARQAAIAAKLAADNAPEAGPAGMIAGESRDAAAGLEATATAGEPARRREKADLPADGSSALRDMLLDLEEAYAFYTGVADAGPDEETLLEAQHLGHSALRRLAVIREALSREGSLPWH